MAFYYVKSGGTATGDNGRATTARTGAFGATSTYYDSIKDVWNSVGAVPTTAITGGDNICVSTLHDKGSLTGAYTSVPLSGATAAPPVNVIAVDDSNMDQPITTKPSSLTSTPREHFTSYLNFNTSVYMQGINFGCVGTNVLVKTHATQIFKNCLLVANGRWGQHGVAAPIAMSLINTDFYAYSINGTFAMAAGDFLWRGGKIHASGSSPRTIFGYNIYWGLKGTAITRISGVDLSHHNTTYDIFGLDFPNFSGWMDCVLERCTMPSTFSLISTSKLERSTFNGRIALYNSDDTTGDKQYNCLDYRGLGNIVDETSVTRTDGDTLADGSTYLALKATTLNSTKVTATSALMFSPYGDRYYDAAEESGSKVRVYFASTDSALTDQDVWVDVAYASSAEPAKGLVKTSVNSDLWFGSGTSLSTDSSSTWTNAGSYTKYYIDVDMTSGGDGPVTVYLNIGKSNTAVIFDSEYDFVA